MTQIHRPHDKLFRETFGDLVVAKDFLRNYLPENLLQSLNLDVLSLEQESFIKRDLREVQSDLLFQAEFVGKRAYLYFLFEHKSYIADDIAFQLLGYMNDIWKREREKLHRSNVSFIVPLVLYHGEKEWRKVKKIADWIFGYQELSESWSQFVPHFEFVMYDFSLASDTEIVGDAKLQAYLRLVKAIREPNEDKLLRNIARIWYIIGLDAADYFETLLIYIVNERDNISLERLASTLNEEGRKIVMTTAERLRMEGREEGREQGREEFARETAVRLLLDGMKMEKVAYLTGLAVEEVERISKGMDQK